MLIETQRLILREMTEKDFATLYRILEDSDIMQHYPYTFDENRVRNWIARNVERYRIFGFGLCHGRGGSSFDSPAENRHKNNVERNVHQGGNCKKN